MMVKTENMRKMIALWTAVMLTLLMLTGCAAGAETRTGEAQGYGGMLRVSVQMNGSDITSVEVTQHSETPGVGTRAIEALPDAIVQADSTEVDSVSGATITSGAIRAAVAQAIGQQTSPSPAGDAGMMNAEENVRRGVGMASTGRLGPGTAEDGSPVYSFNVVFACADFDADGRIRALEVDQLEVLSTQFSGFPEEAEGENDFLTQVSQWTTKGTQGDAYMLGSGSWRQQMDAYQQMMVGKTIDEVNAWHEANFSQETGKPVDNAEGITGATMALRDEHGDILTAIQRAWEDAQRGQSEADGQGSTDTDLPMPTEEGMLNDTNTQMEPTDGGASYG
ncbi:MAG: FMN-binding protein [Clostridia bacterium]|nr:FMN-binding protein [Clostridia bacterium]